MTFETRHPVITWLAWTAAVLAYFAGMAAVQVSK